MINLSCLSFFKTDTIIYDDACHLKRYGSNQVRSHLTPTAERMSHTKMDIDNFHFKNHVDKWYKVHCNPYDSEELKVMLNHYFLTSKNTVIFPLLSQILFSLKVSIFCPLRYQFCSLHTTMFIVGRQAYRVGQNIKLLFL